MNKKDLELLENEGYIVVCESPFEIENEIDGSKASGKAAEAILYGLRKESEKEEETEQPLVLVFYGHWNAENVERTTKHLKERYGNGVLPVFIPAKEDRVDCINPKLLTEEEYKKARKHVREIEKLLDNGIKINV